MHKKFKNSLFSQVFRVIFISFIFFFSLFGIFTFIEKKSDLLDMLNNEAQNISKSIILFNSDALIYNDEKILFKLTFKYLKQNSNIERIILSKNGQFYTVLQNGKWHNKDHLDSKLLKFQKDIPVYDFIQSSVLNKNVYHYVYPIHFSGHESGWVHVSLSLNDYWQSMNKLFMEHCVLVVVIFIFSFLSAYSISRQITKPISLLSQASKDIIKGNSIQIDNISRDHEIGELSYSFNVMTKSLRQSEKELLLINNELERRVQHRTSELIVTNQKLHELNDNLDNKIKIEIEKRKEKEQIILHQSRLVAMGEMIHLIAHQWRQPLNSLALVIQNIKLQYECYRLDHNVIIDTVEQSNKLIQKMSTTIGDFQDFFKPDRNQKNVNLYDLLCSSYELLRPSFESLNIELSIEKSDVYLDVCENKLSQVILNILSNSRDAFIQNNILDRKIFIRIIKNEIGVKVEIDDNAGGISKEIIDNIFEPYFSTKEEKNGMGLGLYMSKVIIEHTMKGELYAEAIQNGTRFRIVLNDC